MQEDSKPAEEEGASKLDALDKAAMFTGAFLALSYVIAMGYAATFLFWPIVNHGLFRGLSIGLVNMGVPGRIAAGVSLWLMATVLLRLFKDGRAMFLAFCGVVLIYFLAPWL